MRRLLTLAALPCMVGVAKAAAPAAPLDATADVLFEYARSLVRDHRYAEACPKFEESLRIRPGIGTRYNLADCWEREGKLASAWAAFVKVSAETHALAQTEREQAARERARSLEPRLGRLAIDAPAESSDVEVRCDGQPVSPRLWSVPLPLDAGKHVVEALVSGKAKWSTVVVVEDGRVSRIALPPPEPRVAPPANPSPPREPPVEEKITHDSQRTVGFILVGGSLLVLGLGALGVVERDRAVSGYNEDPTCPPFDAPTRPAPCQDRVSTASTWKTATVAGFVGGGLLLGVGVALLVTSPPRTARRVACAPAGLGAACGVVF